MANKHNAVLDRIEDHVATILIESISKEINIAVDQLPNNASEGDWLIVEIDGDNLKSIELDSETTKKRMTSIDKRLNNLKSKSKRSRFKKKK